MVPKSVLRGMTLRLPVEVVMEVAPREPDPASHGRTGVASPNPEITTGDSQSGSVPSRKYSAMTLSPEAEYKPAACRLHPQERHPLKEKR